MYDQAVQLDRSGGMKQMTKGVRGETQMSSSKKGFKAPNMMKRRDAAGQKMA